MPTPQFVKDLRRDIGHKELLLPGVSAVVLKREHDDGTPLTSPEILLVRRSDNGMWTVTSGILEPGEDPAPAGVREVHEETGVTARPVRLAGIWAMPKVTHANGDQCHYLDTVMEFSWVTGTPRVNDDESTEVGWFSVDALPQPRSDHQDRKISWALDSGAPAKYIS